MHLAAIDIGTNSLHMIIVRTTSGQTFDVVGREKDMVRLGAGGLEGRPLSEGAMTAALQTLSRFKRLADSRQVDEILAVATSAVREAPNGGDFLAAIEHQTGIRARVITGTEEAKLIHRAAVHGVDVGADRAIVIDIGGGSTEITFGTAAGAQQARSFHLGVIRLGDRYAKRDPLAAEDDRRMVRHITRELGTYLKDLASRGATRIIGTSGTILAVGGLVLATQEDPGAGTSLHHRRVPVRGISKLRKQLARMTIDERLTLPGLDPRRADLVVPGAVLLDIILRQLGAHELTLCEMSLREGVILDYLRRHRIDIERIERYPDVRHRSVVELAQRCQYAADHAHQVARLALSIFDQTSAVHGLDTQAREWLGHAALLHDIGEHVSYERHHRHSYYLVKNGDLRGFEPHEVETMALVARYHRRGQPKRSHPGFGTLPRDARRTVRWLAAMLRLAEGLDRSRAQLVRSITLAKHRDGWSLQMTARGDVELEHWAALRHLVPLEHELGERINLLAPRAHDAAAAVARPGAGA